MNSFDGNSDFEKAYSARIYPGLVAFLAPKMMFPGRNTLAGKESKDGLTMDLQSIIGDFTVHQITDGKITLYADLKVERKSSRNLFFETHSNCVLDPARAKAGWGVTIKADEIWYAFEDSNVIARIRLTNLRLWLDDIANAEKCTTRLDALKLVVQTKHKQRNRTVGRLVPFADMPKSVFPCAWAIRPDGSLAEMSPAEFCKTVLDAANAARQEARAN